MNVSEINRALLAGEMDRPGVLPHLDRLRRSGTVFAVDFGLERLPKKAGILLVRGARQYGKSTWLERELRDSVREFGAGSAAYLNGDELSDQRELTDAIRSVLAAMDPQRKVRRLFIDEITAVANWSRALKRLADAGELQDVLVVTTGSRATDLRRGAERLPGRKGRLSRTAYLFTPISYRAFLEAGGDRLGDERIWAYLISGGSPIGLSALLESRTLPEWLIETVRDWILGECAATGRGRPSLVSVMKTLTRHPGVALGQAQLARQSGLANNTVAAGYVELLKDLLVLGESVTWDASRRVEVRRKPAKYPFVNLLAMIAWHPERVRSAAEFLALESPVQGGWIEWLVAQELWRRAAIAGAPDPEQMLFWQGGGHETDFVVNPRLHVEAKRGAASPTDFTWFPRSFPKADLLVVNSRRFTATRVIGVTLEDFLLHGPTAPRQHRSR